MYKLSPIIEMFLRAVGSQGETFDISTHSPTCLASDPLGYLTAPVNMGVRRSYRLTKERIYQ